MANPDPGTTILGIDPSVRRTGIARWRDGRLSTMTVVPPDTGAPIEARMRWITGHVWPLITDRTFVVVETPYVSKNAAVSMQLAGLHYVLRYGLYMRGVPFGVVTPGELKQFACGNGNADKPAMVQMAAATFGPGAGLAMGGWRPAWSLTDVDAVNDEADALWCLAMGLYHLYLSDVDLWSTYGDNGPVMEPGLSDAQVAVHRKVALDWPELEWK